MVRRAVDRIVALDWHRNGISGEGFYIVLFKRREGRYKKTMLGILFEGAGQCAVLDLTKLTAQDIEFGSNSWRGDHFEPELRQAIKEEEEKQ